MIDIPNIAFEGEEHIKDFDVLTISDLSAKIDRGLDHDPKKPHRIHFFALLVITEGEGYHEVDLQRYQVKVGSVLKIAKGQVHAFQQKIGYKGFLVIFTEDFILRFFSKPSIEFISHLYNYHISDPLVQSSGLNDFFVHQLREELQVEYSYGQQNILAKILELYLLKLERISGAKRISNQDRDYYPLFLQFKNLVEKDFATTRNVKDYASKMRISTKHLGKLVHIFTLNTPKHFIDQYVVLEVKRAILSTDKSLKEIAYDMGFDEVTNFTKFFKKHTEVTPKRFKADL
ncbi:helix-turn-helix domain-containing protein [Zobellia russellii]|uniref:helix-turn-helix domain-containing protein n=1 Tax=Zobellia russellii TaxID=248907 RepID=UPI001BFF97FB|nr:helix-turn-helix transcriptional regulator [Zobellia russellii]MBT9188669.1 helix-turn-helix domain-containing protein [Zobellia russellii]